MSLHCHVFSTILLITMCLKTNGESERFHWNQSLAKETESGEWRVSEKRAKNRDRCETVIKQKLNTKAIKKMFLFAWALSYFIQHLFYGQSIRFIPCVKWSTIHFLFACCTALLYGLSVSQLNAKIEFSTDVTRMNPNDSTNGNRCVVYSKVCNKLNAAYFCVYVIK